MEYLIGMGVLYFVGRKVLVFMQGRASQLVSRTDTMAVEGYIRDDENGGVGQNNAAVRFNPDYEAVDKKNAGVILGDYEYAVGRAAERSGSTAGVGNTYFDNYNYNDLAVSPGIQPAFNFPTIP